MRFFICDDHAGSMDVLSGLIHEIDAGIAITTFTEVPAFFEALEEHHEEVDAVFLDIVFSGKAEIEAANTLHRKYPSLPIVFVTGHMDYALEIFDAAPLYLLGKPFDKGKVASALQAVRDRAAQSARNTITIRARSGLRVLRAEQIEYFESKGRKVTAYGEFEPIEFYGKLPELEKSVPECFARCHQSFLVNMERVCEVTPDTVAMLSGREIPIAKRRSNVFRETFVLYQASRNAATLGTR